MTTTPTSLIDVVFETDIAPEDALALARDNATRLVEAAGALALELEALKAEQASGATGPATLLAKIEQLEQRYRKLGKSWNVFALRVRQLGGEAPEEIPGL